MKKLSIAAVIAVMAVTAIAPAQDNSGTSMVSSGPWTMRKSTGNKTTDRVWFIMDRTLNSSEQQTLRTMFWKMPGNTDYTLRKAIVGAIDSGSKAYPTYGNWWSGDWTSDNGMSDLNVFNAMMSSLDASERGAVGLWMDSATDSQISAITKLVRLGGQANMMWSSSGMNN